MEDTLVLIKPDGVHRGLVGEIITRFERKGLRLRALKFLTMSRELAERHYAVHHGKDFYGRLIDFITAGPVVAMVWTGPEAIFLVRRLVGATCPTESTPGTIRGDYACVTNKNLVHASDSPDTARVEIGNFFEPSEVVEWSPALAPWYRSPVPS